MLDAALVFLVALAGGALPLARRWSDRQLHGALALSTGIFLGAVFLHLLPSLTHLEVAAPSAGAGEHAAHAHVQGKELALWSFVLGGALGVYLVEALFLRTYDRDDLHRHRAVGYAALIGLCLHSATAGMAYAGAREHPALLGPVFVAILAHKGFEAFSLTSVFQLAEFKRTHVLALVVAFALVTPAGILLGEALAGALSSYGLAILTALAAGTFLFVSLCELLPEVFHHREDGTVKVLLLAAGIGAMALFHTPLT